MRGRKLSRGEALAEYLVYRVRTYEYLQVFQILVDIKDRTYVPENRFSKPVTETLQNILLGMFASFIDTSSKALNVFDVWMALYPNEKARIEDAWRKIEPHMGLIRDFRNNVSFHACRNLGEYIKALKSYQENTKLITLSMTEFGKLANDLIVKEPEALPHLKAEAGPILKRAGVPDEHIGNAEDYFL